MSAFDEMLKTKEVATTGGKHAVVGGLPKVSLLPAEFHSKAREGAIKRMTVVGLGAVVVLCALAAVTALTTSTTAQARLESENARSAALSVQIAKFGDVARLQRQVMVGEAAVRVGSSTLIDWQSQLADIEQDMPSDFTVTTISVDSADVTTDYGQGTSPLEKPRAATVVLTAATPSVDGLPHWLRMLRQIPAYADGTASFTHSETTGYNVKVTVHLSAKAIQKNAWKDLVK